MFIILIHASFCNMPTDSPELNGIGRLTCFPHIECKGTNKVFMTDQHTDNQDKLNRTNKNAEKVRGQRLDFLICSNLCPF